MNMLTTRARLLGGAALGLGLTMVAAQPAKADSACAIAAANPGFIFAADCTDPNGNGRSDGGTTGGGLGLNVGSTTAVVSWFVDPENILTTGYTESTTAGKGVIEVTSGSALGVAYAGTGSTLVGQAGATNATILNITASSVAFSSGTVTADGGGSTAVSITATGGAGSGGITATIDGDITAADGSAVVLATTDSAGTGNVSLISNPGTTIQATGGNAITVNTAGTGPILLDLNGIVIGDTNVHATGPVTSGAGTAIDVNVNHASSITDVIVSADGAITGATGGIDVTNNGTGAVSVTSTGAITSTAGDGIAASSITGALTISSGVITAGAVGIYASTTDGALSISQSGALTSADIGIDVQASGAGAVTINRTGTAVLTSTGSTGIQADSTTGAINITTGAISAAAGDGVDAASTTGAITVNVSGNVSGGASDGVQAASTSGDITVNVTGGDVTATGAGGDGIIVLSSGAMSVTIGAGRTVTAGAGGSAIQSAGTGTLTVNNSGTFGTAGGTAVFNAGFGNQNFINNFAGGVMNGRVDLGNLSDTVSNSGTWNVASSSNFYGGIDVVTNNAGGVLNLATGTFFSGLETLANAGTANLNGTLTFDSGDTTMSNSGTFNVQGSLDFDAGTDTLTNSASGIINLTGATTLANVETITQAGRINLDTFTLTGPAIAFTNDGFIDTSGAAGLAGFTTLSNAGTLDLAAGTFTAPAGVFTNTGLILADEGAATITGQTSLANSGTIDLMDGLANDTLTIAGDNSGSGASSLLLDVDDDVADRLIIGGAASGTTTIDANLIGSGILIPGGVLLVDAGTSTADAFVIGNVTGNTSPLLDYGLNQVGGDYFLVGSINDAGFAPLPVALIAGEMWYQSAETVWAQAKLPNDGTRRSSFWGQVYAGSDKAGGNDAQTVAGIDYVVDNRVQTDRYGFQIGAGLAVGGMGNVGVTGGLERAESDGNASSYETRGWNIGAYGTFGGATGFHGSFLAKHDRFDIDLGNNLFDGIDQDAHSNGVDGEVGYRFGGSGGPSFDFSAGLSHVRTKIDDFSLGGLTYDYDRFTSTRGRIGGRVTGSGPMSLFLDGRVYHEFSGDGDVRLADGIDTYRLRADGRGTWARIEAGIGGPANGLAPMISAWVDMGDVKGFGGRGSFRF